MKLFVVALGLVLVAICSASTATDDDGQDTLKFYKVCAYESAITSEELDKYMDIENFVDDPKAQNFFKCYFQKNGFIDQNGDFQEGIAIEKLSKINYPFMTEENMKECTATAGDNKANAFALKLVACYNKAYKKVVSDTEVYIFVSDCADELEITPVELQEYLLHANDYVDDLKAQGFFKCYAQKRGYIDENGNFQESVAIQKMVTGDRHQITEDDVKQCTVTAGDNTATAFALKLYVCYNDAFGKAFNDYDRQDWTFFKHCAVEQQMTLHELLKYLTEFKNFADEPKAQNLFTCFFRKHGFISEDGGFRQSVAIEKLATGQNPVITEEVLKQCTVEAGGDADTFFLQFHICCKKSLNKLN